MADPAGGLTHLFPTPADLTDLDLAGVALPKARRTALRGLIEALTAKGIDLRAGSDWRRSCAQLAGLRGIGPWTVATIAMRALGDPDAFPATDLGVRLAAAGLGLPGTPAAEHAASWRPWRAYAVQYLWAAGDHAVNRLPGDDVAAPTAGSAVGAAAWGETK